MPYEPTDWENFPSTDTPINQEALQHAETQYALAMLDVAESIPDDGTAIGSALVSVIDEQMNTRPFTFTFSFTGNLSVKTGTHRQYNDTGRTLTITSIRASVGVAATGAAILIDVNKNGSTLFTTQANRPTIAVSTFTDTAVADITTWGVGDYLTVDIDQIGSTVAGADLTLTVVAF